jgi:hypothetical protein
MSPGFPYILHPEFWLRLWFEHKDVDLWIWNGVYQHSDVHISYILTRGSLDVDVAMVNGNSKVIVRQKYKGVGGRLIFCSLHLCLALYLMRGVWPGVVLLCSRAQSTSPTLPCSSLGTGKQPKSRKSRNFIYPCSSTQKCANFSF